MEMEILIIVDFESVCDIALVQCLRADMFPEDMEGLRYGRSQLCNSAAGKALSKRAFGSFTDLRYSACLFWYFNAILALKKRVKYCAKM